MGQQSYEQADAGEDGFFVCYDCGDAFGPDEGDDEYCADCLDAHEQEESDEENE
jgi:hypothetical protein